MDLVYCSINNFFQEKLNDLDCQPDTKAYIVSIYDKYKKSDLDLSKQSITLLFIQAREKHSFNTYQKLADWIFFYNTICQQSNNKEYYDTIGKISYHSCYNLINRQWKLFEELSDNFVNLEEQVKNKLLFIK